MSLVKKLLLLNRNIKITIVLINDISLSIIAALISCLFIYDINIFSEFIYSADFGYLLFLSSIIFIPFFIIFGIYQVIFRYSGLDIFKQFFLPIFIYGFFLNIIIFFSKSFLLKKGVFLSIHVEASILQPLFFFILISISRILINILFVKYNPQENKDKEYIIVYGAGQSGVNIVKFLSNYKILGFIDDNITKQGLTVSGLMIFSKQKMFELCKKYSKINILVSISKLKQNERRTIVNFLENFPVNVRFMPKLSQIMKGQLHLEDSQPVNISDLINRKIIWNNNEIKNHILNKVVLVTGAGGSIGSELVRQIIKMQPQKLILMDHSEINIYNLDIELDKIIRENSLSVTYELILGSLCFTSTINNVFINYKPQIVFHAAAYKHVPLTELNQVETIKNNILGTYNLINISLNFNVENFIFISTDKAVRPTSIMGATKRFGEMILQALAQKKEISKKSIISILRFGNVLGSAGSVVPFFNYQIQNKQTLTVTHPEVTRFFMTIPEAVGLILSSILFSKGGEVFVLDMGNPIRILDLAKRMIKLSGLKEITDEDQDGDIKIEFIGLRKGEKLHEELLIGSSVSKTIHKDILKVDEEFIEWEKLKPIIENIEKLVSENNNSELINLLSSCIEEFKSN